MTFARAANILCDSLDVRDRGGVVFYDTTSRLKQAGDISTADDSTERKAQRPAEVVSFSTSEESLGLDNQCEKVKSFNPIDESLLHSLIAKYPRGKLWSLTKMVACHLLRKTSCLLDRAQILRIEDEVERLEGRLKQRFCKSTSLESDNWYSQGSGTQGTLVKSQPLFLKIRSLLADAYPPRSMRWFTGGFAWTTSNQQIFSRETELGFFQAFGNSVMAEISRLASMAADRQKADFIGSISHEFRSPLHGKL